MDAGSATTAGSGGSRTDSPDGSTLGIPPALLAFADDVRRASSEGQTPGGPENCAAPLPAVEVSSATDADDVVREYIAATLAVPVAALREEQHPCGDSTHAACADRFNVFTYSFGGRLSTTVQPLAQHVDADATSQRLTTFTTSTRSGIQAAVLSALQDGWLIGLAVFSDRPTCGSAH